MVAAEHERERCARMHCSHALSSRTGCSRAGDGTDDEPVRHPLRRRLLRDARVRPDVRALLEELGDRAVRAGVRADQVLGQGASCALRRAPPLTSAQVSTYLRGPLVFHNNPPSAVRPRHRNDRVASQIVRDSSGREHMLLNFFVQGQPHNAAAPPADQSALEAALEKARSQASALADMSPHELAESAQHFASDKWESCKKLFRFLSGDPLPSSPPPPAPSVEPKQEKPAGGWKEGLTGLFAGLRPSSPESAGPTTTNVPEEGFVDGEVHADLVMVCPLAVRFATSADPCGRTITASLNSGICE